MHRLRVLVTLAAIVPMARAAHGQPVDPYKQPAPARPSEPAGRPTTPAPVSPTPSTPLGPAAPAGPVAPTPGNGPASSPAVEAPVDPYGSAPVPATQDPMLAERVAAALVARAQELFETRVFLDAKQLAVEALVQSPRGASSEQARAIIRAANRELGIPEDVPKPPPTVAEDVDTAPFQDPAAVTAPVGSPPEGGRSNRRLVASVHGGLYAGLLGTTVGAFFSEDSPASGAVPVGLAVGIGGALALPRLVDRLGWDERQIRTVGAATVWGGVIGGLFGDIAKTETTSAREVLVAASVGSTLAGLGGYAFSRRSELTRGDIALVDTLAGIGAVGGLTLGMVMQPVETEAYSLNAAFGAAGGLVVGVLVAPKINATPRRMARIAGLAAAGGAVPFLLYAAISDSGTNADERLVGTLSTGGLVAGAYLGLRLTRGMDEGLDTLEGKRKVEVDDAPIALIGRSSAGRWGMGGIGLAPLSRTLAPQPGMALQLVGAAF
jgi:hypothetical protein